MRVSNRFLYYQLVKDIGNNTEKLFKLNGQISSGKRIDKPSDDPIGMAKVLDNRSELKQFDQLGKNIDLANGWLSRTESICSDLDNILSRASEIATQMASSTQNATTRAGAAEEVAQLRQEILQNANAKYGNKFIFGGTMTQTQPFLDVDVTDWQADVTDVIPFSAAAPASPSAGDEYISTAAGATQNHVFSYNGTAWVDQGTPAAGSRYIDSITGTIFQWSGAVYQTSATADEGMCATVTNENELYVYHDGQWVPQYQGNDSDFSVQIGKNDTVVTSIPGSELFINGTGNIMMTLMNLESALRSNDQTGISNQLTGIENSAKVVSKNVAKVGAVVNRLENSQGVISRSALDNKESTSDIEDLDYADAITSLQNQQTIYEASLKSASMITSMSLVDFIK